MRAYSIYVFVVLFVVGVIGCAPVQKCVLVSVVDSKTSKPVVGATVSIHFHPQIKTVTGQDGLALLKLPSKDAEDAIFDVEIVNQDYNQNFGYGETESEWMKRPDDFIPKKPDIVLEVVSRFDERQAELEKQTASKKADEAAEKLFRESPNFWPERTNEMAELLFQKRWESASKESLGSQEDIDSIRRVVVRDMRQPQAKVDEIRWVSPSVVMVKSSWYMGPLAAGGYTYVLKKGDPDWTVVIFAMDWIS